MIIALDAIALYPSIQKEVAMALCKEAARETNIEMKNMNLLEATRMLVLTWSEEEVRKSWIKEYLPTRRKVPGKKLGKLGLTTKNSLKAAPNDRSQWVWPEKRVPKKVQKEIFALVVEQFVRIFCTTQTYTWRGSTFLQTDGLPIGPRGTSAVARVTMNFLDRKFKLRLEVLRIETRLLVRYVDDVRVVLEGLRKGAMIAGDMVVIDPDQEAEDDQLEDPEVQVSARVLRQIMDG